MRNSFRHSGLAIEFKLFIFSLLTIFLIVNSTILPLLVLGISKTLNYFCRYMFWR